MPCTHALYPCPVPTPCLHTSQPRILANEASVYFACEVNPPLQLLSSCLPTLPPASWLSCLQIVMHTMAEFDLDGDNALDMEVG